MKTVSATTLTITRTAVNFALFEVPITSRNVISSETRNARRLKPPALIVPSGWVTVSHGPAVRCSGRARAPVSTRPHRLVCASQPLT